MKIQVCFSMSRALGETNPGTAGTQTLELVVTHVNPVSASKVAVPPACLSPPLLDATLWAGVGSRKLGLGWRKSWWDGEVMHTTPAWAVRVRMYAEIL